MFFLSFWILPLISACVWLGMLLAMLVRWIVEGSPHYASMSPNQHIAYISDIGAQGLKPLFITGCVVTTIFLDLSFLSERWLRHTGRLARNTGTAEKVLSAFAIIFAVAGTAGLILLSIFDTLRHPHLHDGFLLLFIAGYVISAIFLCAEYQRLGIHYRQHRVLRMSFWVKLIFILVELVLAIAFGVCNFKNRTQVAAVLEWIIALIFTFWVLSFLIDLLPAVRTKHHGNSAGAPQLELGNTDGAHHHTNMDGTTLGSESGYTNGSTHLNGSKYGNTSGGGDEYTNANGDGYLGDVPTASDGFANRSSYANGGAGSPGTRYYQEANVNPKSVPASQNF